VPVEIAQRKKPAIQFERDEHFRPNTNMADLASLPPVFIPKTGTVTAGNSSGINDGASATLLMSEELATQLGLEPLAFISGAGMGACPPELMGVSPVPAVKDLLKRTGRSIADYQRIEVNEAFASQAIACEKELGIDRKLLNVNGSGICTQILVLVVVLLCGLLSVVAHYIVFDQL
jgi:acetyl-CoA C-acetyltransferase